MLDRVEHAEEQDASEDPLEHGARPNPGGSEQDLRGSTAVARTLGKKGGRHRTLYTRRRSA